MQAKKIKKISKLLNCPKTFPSVQTCFGAILLKKVFCPWFHGVIESFQKNQRNSKFPKCPNRFQKCPRVFWTCFGAIFPNFFAHCSMQGFSDFLDLKIWAQISGLKNKSLVFRTYIYEFSSTTQYSTDILFAFTPQWIYAIAFQMFWN